MDATLPFVEVEPDTKLALQLCASRTSLTGAEFADLLVRLMELCRKQGHAAATATMPIYKAAIDNLSDAELERLTAPPTKIVVLGTPPKEPPEHPDDYKLADPEPVDGRSKPLLEADKANIRQRYKQACEGRERVPNGWFRKIAKEYNRKVSYIYNVIYSAPDYEAVPRAKQQINP